MRTFDNRVITNILGYKTEELTREWKESRNGELHNQIFLGDLIEGDVMD
jgi:hypothetical protein